MFPKKFLISLLMSVLLATPMVAQDEPNLVEVADSAGRFTTLIAAAQATGLDAVLASSGPYTIFAPNDEAFAKLPPGTIEALLADPETLAGILLHHAVPGTLDSGAVLSRDRVRSIFGQFLNIEANDDGAFIGASKILNVDFFASNGVIHEIDAVLIPEEIRGSTYEVTITNLTKGQVFSPPVIASHSPAVSFFIPGEPASPGLKELAEDGLTGPIIDRAASLPQVYQVAVGSGPIGPGESATIEITTYREYRVISALGMLVSTNDSFFAIESDAPLGQFDWFKRSSDRAINSDTFYASVWDAGTEYNSESCDHVPGPSCGGSGSPDEPGEGFVHIANGVQGNGDLSATQYDWNGPAARITIKLKR